MATLRLGQQPVEGAILCAEPWRQVLTLSWSRAEDRPTRIRVDGAVIPDPSEPKGRIRIPWLGGDVLWCDIEGPHRHRVEFEVPRPSESETWFLRKFARALQASLPAGKDTPLEASTIGEISLFVQESLLAMFQPRPLDDRIRRGLGALASICNRPRTWLREEEVVRPIAEVRRPARYADLYLAAHPADAVLLAGRVLPQRLLAVLQEEEFDLYENRLVITLIRDLGDRARRYLARLDQALEQWDRILNELERTLRYGHYRRNKILRDRIWKDDTDLDEVRSKAEAIRSALSTQIRTYGACLTDTLGRHLGACTSTRALRDTNIILHDPNYAVAADLVRALDKERREEGRPDPILDDPDAVYADFVHLLIVRGLWESRYEVEGEGALNLALRRGPVDEQGLNEVVFFLCTGETPCKPGQRKQEPSGWRVRVRRKMGDLNHPPLLEIILERLNEGMTTESNKLEVISTFTASGRPEASPSGRKGEQIPTFWLHPREPQDNASWAEVTSRWASGYVPVQPRGPHPPPSLPVAPWIFESTDRFGRWLATRTLAKDFSRGLVPNHCPVCGGPSRPAERKGDFTCADSQCGTLWGARKCGRCGASIPKILPPRPKMERFQEALNEMESPVQRHRLLQGLGGREMLADLCYSDDVLSDQGFWAICPGCGCCGQHESCDGACVRGAIQEASPDDRVSSGSAEDPGG